MNKKIKTHIKPSAPELDPSSSLAFELESLTANHNQLASQYRDLEYDYIKLDQKTKAVLLVIKELDLPSKITWFYVIRNANKFIDAIFKIIQILK